MGINSQRILLEKDFVNQKGVFLSEEIDILISVAEHLYTALPNGHNPFSFGIGTRRLIRMDSTPQLELVLNDARLWAPPHDRPNFYQEKCQHMLQIAAQPMDYLPDLPNMHEYCEQHENALKNGIIVHSDGMALASAKDEGGWFVFGLRFQHTPSLEDNVFAVIFLSSIVETIFAMDEHNDRLRIAHSAFLTACENWSVELPEKQLRKWISEQNFSTFARCRYERSGPRKFFG